MTFDRKVQTIEVTDNGIDMSREHLAKLFTKVSASAAEFSKDANYKAIGEFGIWY